MRTFLLICLISFGVALASYAEAAFVLSGFLYQAAAVLFEAIRLVMIQKLLSDRKMNPLVSLYYFAPVCAVFNFLAIFAFEGKAPLHEFAKLGPLLLLANCSVAFLLNVASVVVIGVTSGVVLTLCGVLKDVMLVFASMLIYKSPVTPLQAFGYSLALGGLLVYKLGWDKIRQQIQTVSNSARRTRFVVLTSVAMVLGLGSILLLRSFKEPPPPPPPKGWKWDWGF